jgi:diaminopimelate epimerase
MGHARLTSKDYPGGSGDGRGELEADGREWAFQHVSIGNPQCAISVPDETTLAALDLPMIGPGIEAHEAFPSRTNVSWYTEIGLGRIRARIFERGVGETLSSGTGATAAAIAYELRRRDQASPMSPSAPPSAVTVVLDGGELEVQIGPDLSVTLAGWARSVFAGEISEDFLKELHGTTE